MSRCRINHTLVFSWESSSNQALDELLDLALGKGTHKTVDWPPVFEGVDGRYRLDAHMLGDFWVLVDVELDQPDRPTSAADSLLKYRPKLLARITPRRPKIRDDRRLERAVDNFDHEIVGREVL